MSCWQNISVTPVDGVDRVDFVRGKAVIPDEIHLQKKHSSSYVTEEEGNMFRKDYS